MKVYVVYNEEGDSVDQVFLTREAAETFADGRHVDERTAWHEAPPSWTYWHRGAEVYPDRHVVDWCEEKSAQGEVTLPPVDDHLNRRAEPWDGHTQGHCGEHISIFGTDKDAVEAAYQEAVTAALARQNGRCQSPRHTHSGDIDGETVFDAGFLRVRRNGSAVIEQMPCYRYWEHDWRDGSNPDVKHCERCAAALMSWSGPVQVIK